MSAFNDPYWRERIAAGYLQALDARDLDAVAALWERAGTDPELERLLHELNQGLIDEEDSTDTSSDAAEVVEIARRTMPEAFPMESPLAPLTASDVARRLEAEPSFHRLDSVDRATHARLLADASTIPEELGLPSFDRWAAQLGITPGTMYSRLFRKVAILMNISRCQQSGRLAAARRTRPPTEPEGKRESK
jgi:hypothetical protein